MHRETLQIPEIRSSFHRNSPVRTRNDVNFFFIFFSFSSRKGLLILANNCKSSLLFCKKIAQRGQALGKGDIQLSPFLTLLSAAALLCPTSFFSLSLFPVGLAPWLTLLTICTAQDRSFLPKDEGTYRSCESLCLIKTNSGMERLGDG